MRLKSDDRICCITVTYGDRAGYVESLVEKLLAIGVWKLVVVNNGSAADSAKRLSTLSLKHKDFIILKDLIKNSGSARGFKEGIKVALQTEANLFWLLDDDNLPAEDGLDQLLQAWNNLKRSIPTDLLALTAYRKDRVNFQRLIRTANPGSILPLVNSYMGFHYKNVFDIIKKKFSYTGRRNANSQNLFLTNASAYGGLWIHRDGLSAVGYPDTDYVLYMDDFDFTYRFTLKGGKIYLVTSSVISDVENSYYEPPRKGLLYHSLLEARIDAIAYYTCRNVIYFCRKNLRSNKLSYFFNRLLFHFLITLIAVLRGKTVRLRVIYEAIHDAENDCLGEKPGYKLF